MYTHLSSVPTFIHWVVSEQGIYVHISIYDYFKSSLVVRLGNVKVE